MSAAASPATTATGGGTPAGPRSVWPIMVSLVLALIPLQLDSLVAATALPTIAGDLGGFDRVGWIATGFLLAMAVGTVAGGRLGDMLGRQRMLMSALVIFLAGSLWSGLSTGMSELIGARAVQGLGAGMAFTSLLAAVADIAAPEQRARYQSILGAIAPFSMIIGPWVGGVITEHLGWRWIFLLNLPIVGIALVGVALFLRIPHTRATGRVDVAGLAAVTVASSGIVLAVTWGGHQYTWGSWQVLTSLAVALAGLAALVRVERRADNPVLPLHLFTDRRILMAFLVMLLGTGAVLTSAMNYLPLFLQIVQGHSASNSGLLLLPLLLPAVLVALLLAGWTKDRYRLVLTIGAVALTACCVLLATMGTGTSAWTSAC